MLKPRKKISKKELKEDKFVTYTMKVKDFVETHSRMLVQVGIGILVVIILVSFYVRSKQKAGVQANALLGQAQFFLNQGQMDSTEKYLNRLVNNYEGVTAAGHGTFLLAKLHWQQEDYENAKGYFKEYIDEYAKDELLTSAAYAGYADCLLQQDEIQKAAENYEKAAKVDKDSPQAPSYLYSAAQAYMDVRNWDKVNELTDEIIQNYSDSQYRSQAEVLKNMVKFKV